MTDASSLVRSLLHGHGWVAVDVDDDGRVLAVTDGSGTGQLVELAPDGGRQQLTALPDSCSGRYVPGQRSVVVTHDAGGNERTQLSLLDLGGRTPAGLADLTPLVHDPEHIHRLHAVDASSVTYSTNRRNGRDFDVVRRDLATGDERVLYDGGGWVSEVTPDHAGSRVALTSLSALSNSTRVDLAAGAERTPVTDPDVVGEHHEAAFTADDAALVLTSDHDGDRLGVFRVGTDGSGWTPLVTADDHDVHGLLSPDGSLLLAHHAAHGLSRLALHRADGSHVRDVALPDGSRLAHATWSPTGARLAVTFSGATRPARVAVVDAATGDLTVLADAAESYDADVIAPLAPPETHLVPARDGEQIPVFVHRAAGDPLHGATVLFIHGGPEGESTRAWSPLVSALVLAGLNVVVPNVRGSVGYGRRWQSLDDVDKRLESVADLADIHAWLPSVGLDPSRAALYGGSYGGYMTLAGLTMQPQLWAAGVDIVGMSSLVTFLENTSVWRREFREREYGSLERDREVLEQASPMTHLHQLRAPLFIIHGANDPRVPLGEAEQIAAELERKGVRHELMVFHDEGHGLSKRENRLAAYPRAIEFLLDVLG